MNKKLKLRQEQKKKKKKKKKKNFIFKKFDFCIDLIKNEISFETIVFIFFS